MMRSVATTLALVGLGALTACAVTDDGLEPAEGWTEPGWMAKARQQEDAYAQGMISCYAEYGLEATRILGGAVVILSETDNGEDLSDGSDERLDLAATDCNSRISVPDHRTTKTLDDASYQRVLEVRECIVAHGHEAPEPPSLQTWKDSSPMSAWNPYVEMFGGPDGASITQEDLRSLLTACPQSGPTFYTEVPDDAWK